MFIKLTPYIKLAFLAGVTATVAVVFANENSLPTVIADIINTGSGKKQT